VTIKAVRHYHKRGLLEEPQRDASGYRRYTAQHAIDLVKIKTLAEAGVPLARIKALFTAESDQFGAAMAEIDRNLQVRARELRRTRQRISRLSAGDRLFVSAAVAAYLDRLRELGVSQRGVQMERDGWILLQSASPKAAVWFANKLHAIDDPEFVAIYLEYDAAFDWSPDDPRLDALADRTQRWLVRRRAGLTSGRQPAADPGIVQLITTSAGSSSPAWDRLTEISRARMASDGAGELLRVGANHVRDARHRR